MAVDLTFIGTELGPIIIKIIFFSSAVSVLIGVGIFFLFKRIISHYFPHFSKRRTFLIALAGSLFSIPLMYWLLVSLP